VNREEIFSLFEISQQITKKEEIDEREGVSRSLARLLWGTRHPSFGKASSTMLSYVRVALCTGHSYSWMSSKRMSTPLRKG